MDANSLMLRVGAIHGIVIGKIVGVANLERAETLAFQRGRRSRSVFISALAPSASTSS